LEIRAPPTPPLSNSAMMSTLTVSCHWEVETAREKTDLSLTTHPQCRNQENEVANTSRQWLPIYGWLQGLLALRLQFYVRI